MRGTMLVFRPYQAHPEAKQLGRYPHVNCPGLIVRNSARTAVETTFNR
jgi:hypothetical protein